MRRLMKWEAPKWVAVLLLAFAVTFGSWISKVIAQQMQSGGQAVTVTSGTVSATQSGTWTVQPGNTANTTAWKVDGSAVTQPTSLASLPALAAGTAKVGVTYPYTSCGTTAFTSALQAMPTSSTAVAGATTCLLLLNISNTTAGALTVTVSDNAGTPVNFLNAVTLNAGETRTYAFAPGGAKFTSGIKMLASGAGITYTAEGLQ
jgi:hypothetical protein